MVKCILSRIAVPAHIYIFLNNIPEDVLSCDNNYCLQTTIIIERFREVLLVRDARLAFKPGSDLVDLKVDLFTICDVQHVRHIINKLIFCLNVRIKSKRQKLQIVI